MALTRLPNEPALDKNKLVKTSIDSVLLAYSHEQTVCVGTNVECLPRECTRVRDVRSRRKKT